MAETFGFDVEVGATGDVAQRTWSNDFGDGYSQAGGIGINGRSEAWDISVTGKMVEGDKLFNVAAFLDRHEGFKSFQWISPTGKKGRYRANGYKLSTLGAGLLKLSVSFKQVFNP